MFAEYSPKFPIGLPTYPRMGATPDPGTPLKLALAWLVVCATPMSEMGEPRWYYSNTFLAAILDLVAREAFEVSPTPATFAALQSETDRMIRRETQAITRLLARRRARGQAVSEDLEVAAEYSSWMELFKIKFADMNTACVFVDTIEREIRNRINEQEEELDGPEPIERKSPLGLYFRKLLITLRKLSFDETHVMAAHVADWCGQPMPNPPLAWVLNRERIENGGLRENVDAMNKYEAALATGDYSGALSQVRRFYDFRLAASDKAMHQHALLNIATFHYNTNGLESAMEAVIGAIRHARRTNDKACLHKCTQLQYRIRTELESAAWPGFEAPLVKNEPLPHERLQDNDMPADEIWSVKAAVDLGEPVHVAFRRVYTALSYNYMAVSYDGSQPEREGSAQPHLSPALWHGAQAGLWNMLGSNTLAKLHEDMALTSPDLDDETRLEVILVRADRLCEAGQTDEALALVLDGSAIDQMTALCYRRWAYGVWDLLERAASLEADGDALATISGLRGSTYVARIGPGGPVREAFDPSTPPASRAKGVIFAHGEVTGALRRADKLLASHAPAHLALPDVLSALQLAGSLALWPLHTHATLLFAETLLAMDLPTKAEAEVRRVWEQLGPADLARGALVRAKAYAAMAMDTEDAQGYGGDGSKQEEGGRPSPGALYAKAAGFADLALERAAALRLRRAHDDARVLRTLLADIAGLPFPRAVASELAPPAGGDRARRVGEIVRLVGVRVAEGWK